MPQGEAKVGDRTVTTVADLTARHEGKRIRIPDLQLPGVDFDYPHVTVTGKYFGRRPADTERWWWVDVRTTLYGGLLLDTPLPAAHPCFLVSEDPPPGPALVDTPLFGD